MTTENENCVNVLPWVVTINGKPNHRCSTKSKARSDANHFIVSSNFERKSDVIYCGTHSETPLNIIESCPNRIVHERTKVAICSHPDNPLPYFCGFKYCTECLTGKWGHICQKGYHLSGKPRDDSIQECLAREYIDNEESS